MPLEQWGQRPEVLGAEAFPQTLPLDGPLQQHRVDEHQTVLQQLQRQRDDLLLFAAVSGQLALTAIAQKVIGRVPDLHHVEPLVDFMPGLPGAEIVAETDAFLRFAHLCQGLLGRVGDIVGVVALQNRLGRRRTPLRDRLEKLGISRQPS
jgi:hypothetical protein